MSVNVSFVCLSVGPLVAWFVLHTLGALEASFLPEHLEGCETSLPYLSLIDLMTFYISVFKGIRCCFPICLDLPCAFLLLLLLAPFEVPSCTTYPFFLFVSIVAKLQY